MTQKEKYPALFAFGESPIAPLTKEQERSASRDERIKSVWPYLVKTVLEFAETLRPRERANFDAEDILIELWTKLAERDHKYDAERGKYVSFAASVAENELKRVRDRAKTVKPPGNPSSRMRDYEVRLAEGTLSDKQIGTMTDLKRVMGFQSSISDENRARRSPMATSIVDRNPPPDILSFRREDVNLARCDVVKAVAAMDPYTAKLIGQAFGLWGTPALSLAELAKARRRSVGTIRSQIQAALDRHNVALSESAA